MEPTTIENIEFDNLEGQTGTFIININLLFLLFYNLPLTLPSPQITATVKVA
jgi:hypothetical protein